MMINLRNPRLPFAVGGWLSLSLVVVGVLMAQIMNLAACPLCIWQRMLYLLFAVVAFIGMACARQPLARRAIALLLLLVAGAGVFVAGYQVWIQRFAPMTTCAGAEPWWEMFVRWAGEQVPVLFEASGLCSDPAWTFLELSIADWSLLLFLGLAAISVSALLLKSPGRGWQD